MFTALNEGLTSKLDTADNVKNWVKESIKRLEDEDWTERHGVPLNNSVETL
jgi:hypothetical protein